MTNDDDRLRRSRSLYGDPLEDDHASATPPPEILVPFDAGDLMWAAAGYVFWPFVPAVMLCTSKREVPYLRFHFVQSLVSGGLVSVTFLLFTVVLVYFFRSVQSPDSIWLGFAYVGMYGGWLMGLLFCFTWFLLFAWRAGRGDLFKIIIIGPVIEQWVRDQIPLA